MKLTDLNKDELKILFILLTKNSFLTSYIGRVALSLIYSYRRKRVLSKEHREKLSL